MNAILLDTGILLDALFHYETLSDKAKDFLENERFKCYVSAASILEVAIKHSAHPDLMPISGSDLTRVLKEINIDVMPVSIASLEYIDYVLGQKKHKDPFDHIILATTLSRGCILLTKDKIIESYCVGNVLLV